MDFPDAADRRKARFPAPARQFRNDAIDRTPASV
jgi:hypothetical protein